MARMRGLGKERLELIEEASTIIVERAPITVRGVCYGLFVAGIIPGMQRNPVQRVGRALTKAREHGLIDWDDIVDESRELERARTWKDLGDFGNACARQYRRDYWGTSPYNLQVWSEKATVGGLIRPITEKYGVSFLAVHGFGSATSFHDAAEESRWDDRESIILYVGDHDPSGMYMSEVDIPGRIAKYGGNVTLIRIALIAQDLAGLPSFPAKTTDSRFKWYRERYGLDAWELDAMNPNTLRDRVEAEILKYIDGVCSGYV